MLYRDLLSNIKKVTSVILRIRVFFLLNTNYRKLFMNEFINTLLEKKIREKIHEEFVAIHVK